jgi:hypothetical protein
MSHGGRGSEKCQKSVTYYLNGPLNTVFYQTHRCPSVVALTSVVIGLTTVIESRKFFDVKNDRFDIADFSHSEKSSRGELGQIPPNIAL